MKRKFKVINIKYDLSDVEDKEIFYLPNSMPVIITEDDVNDIHDIDEIEDYISDYISETIGFCHEGFNYVEETI